MAQDTEGSYMPGSAGCGAAIALKACSLPDHLPWHDKISHFILFLIDRFHENSDRLR